MLRILFGSFELWNATSSKVDWSLAAGNLRAVPERVTSYLCSDVADESITFELGRHVSRLSEMSFVLFIQFSRPSQRLFVGYQ